MNVVEVEAAARRAADAIRAGAGPRFLECRTYRFRAHSMFDPQLSRDQAEVDAWTKREPISRRRDRTNAAGEIHEADVTASEEEAEQDVDDAVAFAATGARERGRELRK